MLRTLLVCAALLVPFAVRAQETPKPTETVIRLTVRPMPAPKPALKYQLLPELREMNPGNPIQAYLKCFMEQNHFFHNKEAVENREKWQRMPLSELAVKELRGYGGVALRQADYAARLDTPDWQTLLKLKSDGIRLILPEVQQLRMLAAALKVRFRVEIAERRFDDAIATAKTMLALARHLGEHPTLIGELVGIWVASVALGPLEEMIEQPGCPNLYWALTDLPSPFIDLRKGAQSERMIWTAEVAPLDDAAAMSDAQLQQVVEKVCELTRLKYLDGPGGPKGDVRDWLSLRARDQDHVRAARRRLVEYGLAEERVKTFPPLQVVLMDEKREYEVRRDEALKLLPLPAWQVEAEGRGLAPRTGDESLFGQVASAGSLRVRRALGRLEQRIALLRHVEALRLHAAENGGKLPARLADVKVPLPVDPFTGKPFVYKVDGQTAVIQGSPPPGEEKTAAYNVRYEVTIGE